MKNIKTIILALVLIGAIASCKKSPNNTTLSPAYWQVTFNGHQDSATYSSVSYSSTDKNLIVNLGYSANTYPRFMLQGLGTNGNIDILSGTTAYFGVTSGYLFEYDSTANIKFTIQPGNGGIGQFNITNFDLKNKVMSGNFNFLAPISPAGGDTIYGSGTVNNLPIDVTL